jgi:hypothetical protein
MQYAAQLSAPRSLLVPVLALAIGAGGAIGAYAVLDETDVTIEPTRVIVASPVQSPGADAKHESNTAAAIGTSSLAGTTSGPNEAATAAAVGNRDGHIGGGPPAESNDVDPGNSAGPTPLGGARP